MTATKDTKIATARLAPLSDVNRALTTADSLATSGEITRPEEAQSALITLASSYRELSARWDDREQITARTLEDAENRFNKLLDNERETSKFLERDLRDQIEKGKAGWEAYADEQARCENLQRSMRNMERRLESERITAEQMLQKVLLGLTDLGKMSRIALADSERGRNTE